MHPLVQLAKETVECYTKERRIPLPPTEKTPEMQEPAGVFVSLKKWGQLRGCIGTFAPTTPNVAEEIIRNAICAASQDPRFAPVAAEELPHIQYSVDVLSTPEPVCDLTTLDCKRYGVIVSCGSRRGLLLPDLEGVETVADQLSIARRKAGIGLHEAIEIERFEVKRYR